MGRFSFSGFFFSVNKLIFFPFARLLFYFHFPGSIYLIFGNDFLIGLCNIPPKVKV